MWFFIYKARLLDVTNYRENQGKSLSQDFLLYETLTWFKSPMANVSPNVTVSTSSATPTITVLTSSAISFSNPPLNQVLNRLTIVKLPKQLPLVENPRPPYLQGYKLEGNLTG